MRILRSRFTAETPVLVPVTTDGAPRTRPDDRGTVIVDGYTRSSWLPEGPSRRMTAQDLAALVPVHSTLAIDPVPGLSIPWSRSRGLQDSAEDLVAAHSEPRPDELVSAEVVAWPSGALPSRHRGTVAEIAERAGARLAEAHWGPAGARRTAWLVVVDDDTVAADLAQRLDDGLGTTPHPVIFVATPGELPRSVRRRMGAR